MLLRLTTDGHKTLRGLSATAELLVCLCSLMLHWNHYVCRVSVIVSVFSVPTIFISLCKNIERVPMKFAGSDHSHEQIKRLHFMRNRHTNKAAGYDRIFELTSIGCAEMSHRCWLLANEFTNLTAQRKTDAIAETFSRYFNDFVYKFHINIKRFFFIYNTIVSQYLSMADIDNFICFSQYYIMYIIMLISISGFLSIAAWGAGLNKHRNMIKHKTRW